MSHKRKNFHYHYAERYETRAERRERLRGKKQRTLIPPAAVLISVAMLVFFGLISITFSVYVTDSFDDSGLPSSGGLIVTVKNNPVRDQYQSANLHSDSDLASTGANVDLASTGAYSFAGKRLFLENSGQVSTDGSDAKYRLAVYNSGGEPTYYDVADSTITCEGKTYYYADVPSDVDRTHYQWRRCKPSDNTVWNYGPEVAASSMKNATYLTGFVANTANMTGGTFIIFAKDEVLFADATGNSYWSDHDISVSNKNNGSFSGVNMTKIATGLYKYTQSGYWNNGGSDNLYFIRGGSSNAWSYSNAFSIGEATFNGQNGVYLGASAEYNNQGTQTTISLDSLTTPTIDNSVPSFKANAEHTISCENAVSIVLNYTRGGTGYTTTLTDKVYTYYIDGTQIATNTTGSYTIPADYFDNSGGIKAYGNHTIKVRVSSALTGLYAENTTSITVKDPNTCIIYVYDSGNNYSSFSFTGADAKDVNETWSVSIKTAFHTDGSNITATGVEDYVLVSNDNVNFSTTATLTDSGNDAGTLYLKALQPTDESTVTLSCSVGGEESDDSTSASIVVSIKTPTISPNTAIELWQDKTADGAVTVSPASPNSITYGSSNSSLFTVSGSTITPVATSGTANLTISTVYNDSYTFSTTRSVTVKARPVVYLKGLNNGWTSNSATQMAYDYDGSGNYYKTVWLDPSTDYDGGDTWGFKLQDSDGTWYSHSATDNYKFHSTNKSETLSTTSDLPNMKISTGTYGGFYTFTFNYDSKLLTITFPNSAQYFLLGLGSDDNFWVDKLKSDSSFLTARNITDGTCDFTVLAADAGHTFTAGSKQGFKIYCTDGTYYGYQQSSSSYTITHENYSTPITLVSNTTDSYNIGFTAWYSGTYTFSFNTSSKALSITSVPTRDVSGLSSGVSSNALLVTVTDNWNDTFTVTAADTNYYHFNGWTLSGTYTLTSGALSDNTITLKVTATSAVTATAAWVYREYDVYYHTVGGTMSGDGITLVTSGKYRSTYTYSPTNSSSLPPVTAPAGKDVTPIGWYLGNSSSSDYSTARTTIPAGTYGELHLWYYWQVTLTFKDNITGSQIHTDYHTRMGTSLGSYPTDDPEFDIPTHVGFTLPTTNRYAYIGGTWSSSTVMDDSKTIYLVYRPVTQAFSVTVDTSSGITSAVEAGVTRYTIPYGASLSLTATVNEPSYEGGDYAGSIVYYWDEVEGNVESSARLLASGITTKENDYIYTNPDITSLIQNNNGTYTIYVKAYYPYSFSPNGVGNHTVWSTEGQHYTFSYTVNTPLSNKNVTLTPLQKIYAVGDSIGLKATLSVSDAYAAIVNDSPTGLVDYVIRAALKQFNKFAKDFTTQIGDPRSVTYESSSFFTEFTNAAVAGVNYYKIALQRPKIVGFDSGTSGTDGDVYKEDDEIQYADPEYTNEVRITVGTASDSAARPLYVTCAPGVTINTANDRFMMFYIDSSSNLRYQTAATFTRTVGEDIVTYYRFMIPGDVEEVKFGVYAKTAKYILPACDGTAIDFTGTGYKGYSAFVDVVTGESKTPIRDLSITALDAETKVYTVAAA